MEISVFMYGFVVSCVFICSFPYLEAKTVSLNELIAAESRRSETQRPQELKSETQRFQKSRLLETRRSVSRLSGTQRLQESRQTKTQRPQESRLFESQRSQESRRTETQRPQESRLFETQRSQRIATEATDQTTHGGSYKKYTTGKPTGKKSLFHNKGLKKFQGILSDLETGASDVIRVLRHKEQAKAQDNSHNKPAEAERLSLNKLLFRDTKRPRELQITELITPRGKKLLSSLKYRKKFQIKSPLKPKKSRHLLPRYKRKNKSVKRQVNNGRFNKQYIPLLRSLSMLFDNVLGSESREIGEGARDDQKYLGTNEEGIEGRASNMVVRKVPYTENADINQSRNRNDGSKETRSEYNEIKKRKNKTNTTSQESVTNEEENGTEEVNDGKERSNSKDSIENNGQGTCSCANKSAQPIPQQAAAVATTTEIPDEATPFQAPPTTANNTSPSDVGSLRQDTDVPPISPGNTTSIRRNNTRLSEGSGTTFHRGSEGNITGDHRDSEHHSRSREGQSNAAYDEADTIGATRDRADGGESAREFAPVYRGDSYEVQETQIFEEIASPGNLTQFEGENIVETVRDEAESTTLLPEFIRGRRIIENSVGNKSEPLQPKKDHEESFNRVFEPVASDRGFIVGDGAAASEVEEVGPADERVTLEDLGDPVKMLRPVSKGKTSYVTIIDGYSVARDINGRNKISEHTIRIHS